MRSAMEDLHGKVLRKFHTLCTKLGMTTEQKYEIVYSFGVESSRDINTHDLIDICAKLSGQMDAKAIELDRLRKRAMASIGGYLRQTGAESNSAIIKGIACRATGYKEFNKIPVERLRNICYAFANKQKDSDNAEAVKKEILARQMLAASNGDYEA